jgi:ribulose-phosphate 3-epimerase
VPDRVPIEVDGGVDPETAPRCQASGARVFVAGSHVFGSDDPPTAYRAIVDSLNGGAG